MKNSDSKTKIKVLDHNGEEVDSTNNYKIYNYFKEHTSFCIAIVSVLVGFISTLFQFIIYIFKQFELSMWNISMIEFDLSITQNYYYSIILCISICFISISLIAFLTHYCQKILVFNARRIYLKEYIKKVTKEKEDCKKEIEEQNSKMNNLIENGSMTLQKTTEDIKDDIKNIGYSACVVFFIDIIIPCLLCLVMIIQYNTKQDALVLSALFFVIFCLSTIYMIRQMSKKIIKTKTIRDEAKIICENQDLLLLNKKRKLL